jgi:PKD repeat protein
MSPACLRHWRQARLRVSLCAFLFLVLPVLASSALAGSLNLAWDAVTGASGYRLAYGTTSGNYSASLDTGSKTVATVSGLTEGARYFFAVQAYDSTRTSAYSNEINALVPATAAAPVANFTATPLSGGAPLTVKFTDASSGSITAWSWSFGNGATSTLQSPTYTYSTAGTYSVSLTVTGPGGTNTLTKSDYVTVAAAPPGGSVSTTGLVAAYGLEETSGTQVLDASGLANHGTLSNATRTTQAIFGQALSFNGYNSLVSVKDSDSLKVTTGLTLVAWIRPDRLNIRQPIVTKQGTTTTTPVASFTANGSTATSHQCHPGPDGESGRYLHRHGDEPLLEPGRRHLAPTSHHGGQDLPDHRHPHGDPLGHRGRGHPHGEQDHQCDGHHRRTGGGLQWESGERQRAARGEVHRCLHGLHHRLVLELRQRGDQQCDPESDRHLCGRRDLYGLAHRHRSGGSNTATKSGYVTVAAPPAAAAR